MENESYKRGRRGAGGRTTLAALCPEQKDGHSLIVDYEERLKHLEERLETINNNSVFSIMGSISLSIKTNLNVQQLIIYLFWAFYLYLLGDFVLMYKKFN